MSSQPNDKAILRLWLRDRDVRCPVCGYNLRQLTRPVCPECGNAFELAVASPSASRWTWPVIIGVLCGMLAFQLLAALVLVSKIVVGASLAALRVDLGLTTVTTLVIAGYLYSCVRYRRVRRPRQQSEHYRRR